MMRDWYEALAGAVCIPPAGTDRVTLHLAAEDSTFLRFNRALVRQATHVVQRQATVGVVAGLRRASATVTLTGDAAADIAVLAAERDALAAQLALVPEDPFLLLPEAVQSTERDTPGRLPEAAEVIEVVAREAAGTDLVGLYAGGPVVRAFADSRGQRNWHRVESFHFDWSLVHAVDLAVKAVHAGGSWDRAGFAARMAATRAQLELLARPRRTLEPGAYRAYLSPVAVADLLGTLAWSGFGARAARTGVSSLVQLQRGERHLHPALQLADASDAGLAPCFTEDGFVKPARVVLVRDGRAADLLVSPRSAREYGLVGNSGAGETPEWLELAPGSLPAADALQALGTGVYVSDVHYLNYSDRQACRITGMTRFACMWVEDGVPVAPLAVMRFDDALLRMFGEGLVALTDRAEPVPDGATYGARRLAGIRAPGALVDGFVFTL